MKPFALIPAAVLATLTLCSAAAAEPQRLVYSDLDLTRPDHARALDLRIARIAYTLCNNHTGLDQLHCERSIRNEALGKLPAPARADYVTARQHRETVRAAGSTS